MQVEKKKKPISFSTDEYGNPIFHKGLTFREWFKKCHMPLYLSFLRWILIDAYRGKQEKIFGIYMFCGLFGEGKTISMVRHALTIKERNPDVKIYANFKMSKSDGFIKTWEDILEVPNRSIVLIDEIQGTFSSESWKEFPPELLLNITQCRKRQIQVCCTAQVYKRVTVQIRQLAMFIVQCKNIGYLDRLFRLRYYHSEEYEDHMMDITAGKTKKIQPIISRWFVADDDMYNEYDTSEFIESLRKKHNDEKKKILVNF